jgi:anti-sigma regulatory factor (Ser/Thr protein kinase)
MRPLDRTRIEKAADCSFDPAPELQEGGLLLRLTAVRWQDPKKRKNMAKKHLRPDRRMECLEDYTQ